MVDVKNARIIKTPLWSTKAKEVLDSVLGQLSDGWGENNPRNDRYWMFARVLREADGRVVIMIDKRTGKNDVYGSRNYRWIENAFASMNDFQIVEFFARMIKKTAKMELKDRNIANGWKRDNVDFKTAYLNYNEDISIAEVYCIYEMLLNRPVGLTKYDISVINSAVGVQKSPEETVLEQKKMDDIELVKEEFAKKCQELNESRSSELKIVNDKYDALKDEAWKQYKAKLMELGYKG